MMTVWAESAECWARSERDRDQGLGRSFDNERVTAFFLLGSISTAIGLALLTDALHRRVRGDDLFSRTMSGYLKWNEFAVGIAVAVLGITLLAFALTS
jgi:hypothetical protein